MADAFRDWLRAWENFSAKAVEFRELDDERVLVLVDLGERSKTSRLELGQTRTQGAALFQLRCSRVTRLVHYLDRDRALDDLGLNE